MQSTARALLPLAALFLSTVPLSAAGDIWRDSTRDVYVDARLDRSAQVLVRTGTQEMAVVSPQITHTLLLDRDAGSFQSAPSEAFHFSADRATAELAGSSEPGAGGSLQKVGEGGLLLFFEGHTVFLARHQGAVGEISQEKLWATVPVWKNLMEAYQPPAGTVAAYRKLGRRATLTVVFGTWCGDSKEFVPRLLKTVRTAGNPNLVVKLVALDNQFLEPHEVIQGRRIINVPTVIVESGGREMGRVVETPAEPTIEGDVLAILEGRSNEHRGRYERGPEIARGTYLYRDGSQDRGREDWILYETTGGGRLLHSRVFSGGLSTEVFEGTDASGRLQFAEVTKRQGEGVMRVRYRVDGHTLTGWLRGREAGILEQNLVLPDSFAFAAPAIAASGWMSAKAPAEGNSSDVLCYVAPESFGEPLGETCVMTFRGAGEESVRVPAGEFAAVHLARQRDREFSD